MMNAINHHGATQADPLTKSGLRAFTLTELMVACVLSTALGGMLVTVFSGVASSWQSSDARAEAYRESRAALHLMQKELSQSIPLPVEQSRVLLRKQPSTTFTELQFLAHVPANLQPQAAQVSDVCGIVYFLARPSADPQTPADLYRRLITSDEMFDRLKTGGNLFSDASNAQSPHAELIARNVLAFEVLLRDDDYAVLDPALIGQAGQPKPSLVELRLVVVGSKAATLLSETLSTEQRERIETRESRAFTQRLRL